MKVGRRMTATDFEAVLPLLNISEDRCNAARGALVDGKSFQAMATIYGITRQAVGKSVDVVWEALERYQKAQRATANAGALLPPGWEQITLIAPSHLVSKFRAEIAQEAANMSNPTNSAPPKTD